MPKISKDDILEKFLVIENYGENGWNWPSEIVAACKISWPDDDEDDIEWVLPRVYRNDEKHAEVRLIEYLRWDSDILQARKIEIEVYMNYSPCSSCATTILDYVKEMKSKKKEIKMTIAFANFYKTHVYQGNTRATADDNIKGLQELREYRERGVEMKLQLLGVHVEWKTFLNMKDFFRTNFGGEAKRKCLSEASLPSRTKREKKDEKFWKDTVLKSTESEVDSVTSAAANLSLSDNSDKSDNSGTENSNN